MPSLRSATRIIASIYLLLLPSLLEAQDLVVLTETGTERAGRPVFRAHPQGKDIIPILDQGLTRRVVRLYSLVQAFRSKQGGPPPEPAYLLLSKNQGGFPRYGFVLEDLEKPDVAYVDLHESSALTGRFGAVDQIFPHELAHIFLRQLIGDLGEGGSNQVHATGLRTDRATAFNEGFAETFQVLALDDPKAPAETALLTRDLESREFADRSLRGYQRELLARWGFATPYRMRFLFWFSRAEDVLRYHASKQNQFAYRVDVPDYLLTPARLYRAYLAQSVTVAPVNSRLKPIPVLLSTEGVISHLFYRWLTSPQLIRPRAEPEVYREFAVEPGEIEDLENALLKLFFVFSSEKPRDVAELVAAYQRVFPRESRDVQGLVEEVFSVPKLVLPVEIWLANPGFQTGTTLFDQYRGLPRTHTFDLNAATLVDLMGVEGLSMPLARQLLSAAPYSELAQVNQVEGMTKELFRTFVSMVDEMEKLRVSAEEELDLSISVILTPFGERAVLVLVMSTLLGGGLYRLLRRTSWWRALLDGFAISLVFLSLTWLVTGMAGWAALGATGVFWIPAGAWQWFKKQSFAEACRVCVAWLVAAVPALLLTTPIP